MNFDISEEQQMLRESVARFIQDNYDFDTRRGIAASEETMNRQNWQTFAELGWLSIPFEESVGGFGGNAVDTMVIMEQLGKGLVLEPYVATVLLFGGVLQAAGSDAQKEDWLSRIISGEVLGALAYLERHSRFELNDIATTAAAEGDGYVLNGEKTVVFGGVVADSLIVTARTSGEQRDRDGISLFLVDANAAGLSRTGYQLMDGQRVANVSFDNCQVSGDALVGELDGGLVPLEAVVNQAIIGLCAEAVGIMEKLNATTVEYARTREQFGTTIGSFQALQHRMVDTMMSYEQCKSMLYRAVCSVIEGSDDAQRDIHALKVMTAWCGKHIGDEAIQLHGGMGMTDELDVGHYVKRLMMINTTFGSGDYHQAKFCELSYG